MGQCAIAHKSFGRFHLVAPACGISKIGMGKGTRKARGRDRLADGFVHPENQRADTCGLRQVRLALVKVGIEEARQKRIHFGIDITQSAPRVEDKRRRVPIARPCNTEDAGRVGRRNIRALFHHAAGICLGARQKGHVEPAAEGIRQRRIARFDQRLSLFDCADVQKFVRTGQEELPLGTRPDGGGTLGKHEGDQEFVDRGQGFEPFGLNEGNDIRDLTCRPEVDGKPRNRKRQKPDPVGRRTIQRRHTHLRRGRSVQAWRGPRRRKHNRGFDASREPVDGVERFRILRKGMTPDEHREQGKKGDTCP